MVSRTASSVEENPTWMPCPRENITFPTLAHFCSLDHMEILDKADAIHALITTDGICYTVFNKSGEKIFAAVQDSNFTKYHVRIFNIYGNEVIEIKRRVAFTYEQTVVWSPAGTFAGLIQRQVGCVNCYSVKNAKKKPVLKITRQTLNCDRVLGHIFRIISNGAIVGAITESHNPDKKIVVTFPMAMDVQLKALLLAGCLLIDYIKNKQNTT